MATANRMFRIRLVEKIADMGIRIKLVKGKEITAGICVLQTSHAPLRGSSDALKRRSQVPSARGPSISNISVYCWRNSPSRSLRLFAGSPSRERRLSEYGASRFFANAAANHGPGWLDIYSTTRGPLLGYSECEGSGLLGIYLPMQNRPKTTSCPAPALSTTTEPPPAQASASTMACAQARQSRHITTP